MFLIGSRRYRMKQRASEQESLVNWQKNNFIFPFLFYGHIIQ